MGILRWDKPPKTKSTEQWRSVQADGAPPGTYQPNMSAEDAATWRAELKGKTTDHCVVEIRRDLGNALLLVKVARDGVIRDKYGDVNDGDIAISLNGTGYLTFDEWVELGQCVEEAAGVLAAMPRGT